MPERDRTERDLFAAIDARRNDREFMARLQRHVDENRVVLDRLAEHDEDDDPGCTHCGGEGLTECDDPIQCTSSSCDGQICPCKACGGSGRAEDQVIF